MKADIDDVLSETPKQNLVQLSMDEPNVNWSLFHKISADLKKIFSYSMLNVESCGLHTVNNCFKHGADASSWDISRMLSSCYHHFKDSPTRYNVYIKVTGSNQFPQKCCQVQWYKNSGVCQHLLDLWSVLLCYVEAMKSRKMKDLKNKSFSDIKEACADVMRPVKLACFHSVSQTLSPFLTSYQTDQPMLPFLYQDLGIVVKNLCHFVKAGILRGKTLDQLLQLNVEDEAIHVDYTKIGLGLKAEQLLKKACLSGKKVTDKDALELRLHSSFLLYLHCLKNHLLITV